MTELKGRGRRFTFASLSSSFDKVLIFRTSRFTFRLRFFGKVY